MKTTHWITEVTSLESLTRELERVGIDQSSSSRYRPAIICLLSYQLAFLLKYYNLEGSLMEESHVDLLTGEMLSLPRRRTSSTQALIL